MTNNSRESTTENDSEHLANAKFPWILSLLLCWGLTLFLLAPTLRIPFYLSDDSFLIYKARDMAKQVANGDLLAGFYDKANESRYFPGFYYYQALKLYLLGLDAMLWHFYHVCFYTVIGTLLTWFSWFLVRSIVPGFLAYALMISTGQLALSSNWFNFITLYTFEPPLLLLWLSSAYLLLLSSQLKRRRFFRVCCCLAAATLTAWSLVFKETSFLIISATLSLLLIWRLGKAYKHNQIRQQLGASLAILAMLTMALAWGAFVYSRIPHNSGYGGTESLNLTPSGIWDGIMDYAGVIKEQSDYLILFGLSAFGLRLLLSRRNLTTSDYVEVMLLLVGFFQILTLTIWPYIEGRYVQPAYACFLLVSFCEFWWLWNTGFRNSPRSSGWLILGLVVVLSAIPVIFSKAVSPGEFEPFVRWYCVVLGLCSIGWLSLNRKEKHVDAFARTSVIFSGITILVVVMLQSAIMRAFIFTEYECRQGIRHKIVRTVADQATQDAAVFWVVNPDNHGHAWAADMNLELVWDRADLIVGPSNWVITQRKIPKRGDILIDYTLNRNFKMTGTGQLSRTELENGGPTFWLKNTEDARDLLVRILFYPDLLRESDFKTGYQSVTANVYQVKSPTWEPTSDIRQQYFSAK